MDVLGLKILFSIFMGKSKVRCYAQRSVLSGVLCMTEALMRQPCAGMHVQSRYALPAEESAWVCRAKKQDGMYYDGQLHFSPDMRRIKQSRHVLLFLLYVKGKTGKKADQRRQKIAACLWTKVCWKTRSVADFGHVQRAELALLTLTV